MIHAHQQAMADSTGLKIQEIFDAETAALVVILVANGFNQIIPVVMAFGMKSRGRQINPRIGRWRASIFNHEILLLELADDGAGARGGAGVPEVLPDGDDVSTVVVIRQEKFLIGRELEAALQIAHSEIFVGGHFLSPLTYLNDFK